MSGWTRSARCRTARSSPWSSRGTGPRSWSSRWPRWRSRRTRSPTSSSSTTGRTSRRATSSRRAASRPPGCRRGATWAGRAASRSGMLHALALGADWVWLGDDDGRAADETVLATLLDVAQRRMLAAVSPVVVDADDPDRLAFTVRRGLTWHTSRSTLAAEAEGELLSGHRRVLQRGAVPRGRAGDDRRAGPAAVRPRRRGGAAPADGAVQAAVRHEPVGRLPAPARHGRPQADARRAAARPAPRRRGEAVLHLPQPRLPGEQAGDAARRAAGAAPVRLVLPRHPARPRRGSPSGCGCCGRAGRSGSTGSELTARAGRRSRGSRRARTAPGPARGRRRSS